MTIITAHKKSMAVMPITTSELPSPRKVLYDAGMKCMLYHYVLSEHTGNYCFSWFITVSGRSDESI